MTPFISCVDPPVRRVPAQTTEGPLNVNAQQKQLARRSTKKGGPKAALVLLCKQQLVAFTRRGEVQICDVVRQLQRFRRKAVTLGTDSDDIAHAGLDILEGVRSRSTRHGRTGITLAIRNRDYCVAERSTSRSKHTTAHRHLSRRRSKNDDRPRNEGCRQRSTGSITDHASRWNVLERQGNGGSRCSRGGRGKPDRRDCT